MANNAILSSVEGSSERSLRMANYLVPLFWLACLSPGDSLVKDQLDENDPDDYLLYVDVSPKTALSRFQSRNDGVEAILEGVPGDHSTFREAWVDLLSHETGTLRFDLTEIICMKEEGEGEREFRLATTFFENPTNESAEAIIAMTCLSDIIQENNTYPIEDYILGYVY